MVVFLTSWFASSDTDDDDEVTKAQLIRDVVMSIFGSQNKHFRNFGILIGRLGIIV